MQPNVKLDRTLVAVEVGETVHVMLELVAPPAPSTERAPIDVVAVIDRSGSMQGQPLASVIEATNLLVRLLGPDDRIAVVTFDDRVDMVMPLAHHDPARAADVLSRVHAGGSTNLSGGWLKGFEILTAHGRPEAMKRVIVLTDGAANAGIVDRNELAGIAGAARAQQVTTSMVGFGHAYDEQMLATMADAGGGNDYWCAGPDQAPKVFADEFTGLASVVAQNISVEIRPTDATDGLLVLNEYPVTDVDGGMQVALGDAFGDERRRVVAMLHLKPTTEIGSVHVADLVVRWAGTISPVALHTVVVPVTVGAAPGSDADRAGIDPVVTEEVNVLKIARARKAANEAAGRGDHDTAARTLDGVRPLTMNARMTSRDLGEFEDDVQRMASREWSDLDSKRMHSNMRQSSKGRKARYDEPANGPEESN
ncbi:MAG: VWA domain-containing protein [Ilumatobacteraceae bacterium]